MLILPPQDTCHALLDIARNASDIILKYYQENVSIAYKADASPVTVADQMSNDYIVDALSKLTPSIPIIAEESADDGETIRHSKQFWLVDPLDGTKEFINKNGDFTINIALIENRMPTLAILYVPVQATAYLSLGSQGAYRVDQDNHWTQIHAKAIDIQSPTMVVSRSHLSQQTQNFIDQYPQANTRSRGSSLKFCLLAEGLADIYPRFGRTMEWDTAAGHAVLLAAGGSVETLDHQPLSYGKAGLDNPHFIAYAIRD